MAGIVVGMSKQGVVARPWAVLAVVCAAQFLTIVDLWIVNIALPSLRHAFAPASLSAVSWVLDAYAIVLTALLVPAGRIAGDAGRRACFLAGLAGFGVASLGCGLAPALPVLIGFRVLQAAAAALLMPVTLGLALPAFPAARRGTVVGIWSAVAGVAAGGGPVLGGLLVAVNWRWIFLINVPVVAAALAAAVRLLPRGARRVRAGWPDLFGTLLVLCATGLVCLALTEAPAWPAARTAVVMGSGLSLAVAFVRHIRTVRDPLVSPRIFAAGPLAAGAAGLVAYYLGFSALLLGTTLLLADGMHYTAVHVALAIAPAPAMNTVLSPLSGHLVSRLGSRRVVAAGSALFAAAAAWPLLHAGNVSYPAIVLPSMLLWGVANALIYPTLFATANTAPPAELTSGLGVLNMARQLGAALGIAVAVPLLGSALLGSAVQGSAPHGSALQGSATAASAGKLPQAGHAWLLVLASAVLTGGAGLALSAARQSRVQEDPETLRPDRRQDRSSGSAPRSLHPHPRR